MIYFIQQGIGGPIKIGRSKRLKKRMVALRISNTTELTVICTADFDDEVAQEAKLHKKFKRYCLKGEWFYPVPKIMETVQKLRLRRKREMMKEIREAGKFNPRYDEEEKKDVNS